MKTACATLPRLGCDADTDAIAYSQRASTVIASIVDAACLEEELNKPAAGLTQGGSTRFHSSRFMLVAQRSRQLGDALF
jgi:hypothetical protein